MTYTFYTDPGHGWLQVPKSELIELGVADRISSYSYQELDTVYLEEDCDLSTFFKAKGWTEWPREEITKRYLDDREDCFVRQLESYKV